MAHWTQDLEELCEKITDELAEANKKLDKGDGKMTAGDVEYIDKLTHTLKSIKTTLAMAEYDDDYSHDYMGGSSYARGDNRGGNRSNRGGSYARGNGRRNPRRDSMGRYSREGGYSRDEAVDEMADAIREGMSDMPEELKKDAQRFLNKLESM